jgi:tetratricopeptide (TPR) repeat protein
LSSEFDEPGVTPAEDPVATLALAKQLIADNDRRKAARLLEQVVAQIPDPEALLLLAKIEMDRIQTQPQALEHLRRATVAHPQLTEAWLMIANYWSLRGQLEKQRRCLEKILAYDPRNSDARSTLELLLTRR